MVSSFPYFVFTKVTLIRTMIPDYQSGMHTSQTQLMRVDVTVRRQAMDLLSDDATPLPTGVELPTIIPLAYNSTADLSIAYKCTRLNYVGE